MESWENIILQWINCLCSSNDSIKSIEELQDGKIYYNLINRVIPWSSKETDNEKAMVLQFLGDEYPNFAFRNRNSTISNLCTASLILSRLSLEPVFHKSLCINLDADAQVTIKSILESVYSLGKRITAEDLCEIFSLSSKKDFKSLAIKPKFILEEFLKSPAARTIQNDKKQFEQAKQIRQLKAEIETMKYEKSELVEDMKAQDRQMRDLQNKLQEALSELKAVNVSSSKRNSCNFSVEGKDKQGLETAYLKEMESLEKYVSELQTDNYQLQDEKKSLSDEVKLYKQKCQLIKERNEHNEHAIETMLVQIEKKEDELVEMKMKYDELLNHVKEKTKTFFNNPSICNQSIEVDDRMLTEISFNKSEALSSVIEIQLEEVRKDYNILQKQYKHINILLDVFMEEYEKLKRKNESLIISHRETRAKLRAEYMTDAIAKIQNDLIKNDSIIREKIKKEISCSIDYEVKLPLINILKEDMSKNTLFLQLLNNDDTGRYRKTLQKNISYLLNKKSDSLTNAEKILEEHDRMVKIKHYSEKPPLATFNVAVAYQSEFNKPIFVFKVLLQEIVTGLVGVTTENDILEELIFKITNNDCLTNNADNYLNLINFVKRKFKAKRKCLNAIEHNNNVSSERNRSDWNTWNLTWCSWNESLESDVKKHKALLLLEESWFVVSALVKKIGDCESSMQPGFEELLRKKDIIEREMKYVCFQSSHNLFFNLIAAVELLTILTTYCNQKRNYVSILAEDGIQVTLRDIDKLNEQRRNELSTKLDNVQRKIKNFNYSLSLYKVAEDNEALKNTVQNEIDNLTNNSEINDDQTDDKDIKNICTDTIKKEVVEGQQTCLEMIKQEPAEEIVAIEMIKNELIEETKVFVDQNKEDKCNKADTDLMNKNIPEVESEPVSEDWVCVDLVKEEVKEEEPENISSKIKTDKEDVVVESIKNEAPDEKTVHLNTTKITSEFVKPIEKETESALETKPTKTEIVKPIEKEPQSALEIKSTKTEIVKPIEKETESALEIKSTKTEIVKPIKKETESALETKSTKKEEPEEAGPSKSDMTPQQIERYVREIHEKYELKLERMKDKMKAAFNSQVSSLRREQEQSFKTRLDALQAKLEQQCYSHSEELRKYKKHISELTTQLWDVGEKLIIEKQKKEEFVHKVKELKTRHESSLSQHAATLPRPRDKENRPSAAQPPVEQQPLSKMQSVRGFQIMGNAFRSEDEEGELFDTTYLTDVQRQRPSTEVDRLSILQMRNAKCKPHLKSSYPAEMQFYPAPLTEDEIKTGSAQDETFNDSLSQSLLTGKKVKRKDRTRTGAETPRSRRRFSNIFRKPRLSLDHK